MPALPPPIDSAPIVAPTADELQFLEFAQSIGDVIYVINQENNRLAYISPAYERVFQRPTAELLADPASYLLAVHPEDRGEAERAIALNAAGSNSNVRYRLLRSDGSIRHIHARAFSTTNPATGQRRIIGIAEDVTEVAEAQALIARNARTFESLVRDNPFGIYVIDNDFRLFNHSRGAHPVFAGIEPLIGRDFAEILRIVWTEPFASEAIARFRHTLSTGEPYVSYGTIEVRANVDATEAYDWRIEQISLPDGRTGVVCYFYDLSERMALEDKLRQALADKDLLMQEVDHRVRNNLAMIGSLLSMQRTAVSSPEARDALEDAAARVVAIGRLHERLYRSERIGMVDFAAYLESLCRDVQESVGRGDLTFEVVVAPAELSADVAVPLGIIANELVTNACKHCPQDRPGTVAIHLESTAGKLVLSVGNPGPGMAADFSPKDAAGLGLRVIDALSRQIGATIAYPGAGQPALFTVALPLDPAAA